MIIRVGDTVCLKYVFNLTPPPDMSAGVSKIELISADQFDIESSPLYLPNTAPMFALYSIPPRFRHPLNVVNEDYRIVDFVGSKVEFVDHVVKEFRTGKIITNPRFAITGQYHIVINEPKGNAIIEKTAPIIPTVNEQWELYRQTMNHFYQAAHSGNTDFVGFSGELIRGKVLDIYYNQRWIKEVDPDINETARKEGVAVIQLHKYSTAIFPIRYLKVLS